MFSRRLHEQMVKMSQSLHRLQVTWQEAQRTGSPMSEQLLEQFERLMIVYLSTKAATTQPAMLQCCLNLQASTAALLVQLSMGNQGPEHVALSFPLHSLQNTMLCYVPGRSDIPLHNKCNGAEHLYLSYWPKMFRLLISLNFLRIELDQVVSFTSNLKV